MAFKTSTKQTIKSQDGNFPSLFPKMNTMIKKEVRLKVQSSSIQNLFPTLTPNLLIKKTKQKKYPQQNIKIKNLANSKHQKSEYKRQIYLSPCNKYKSKVKEQENNKREFETMQMISGISLTTLNVATIKSTTTLECFCNNSNQKLIQSLEQKESQSTESSLSSISRIREQVINSDSEPEEQQNYFTTEQRFKSLKKKISKYSLFKLAIYYPRPGNYNYEKALNYPYSTHSQKGLVQRLFLNIGEENKWSTTIRRNNLRIFSMNCAFGYHFPIDQIFDEEDSDGFPQLKKYIGQYWQTTKMQRAKQIVEEIHRAIQIGVDFICLQQINHPIIRLLLLELLQKINKKHENKYFYPMNLKTHPYFCTTIILSRHPVKFGHLRFDIPQFLDRAQNSINSPLQAFCQFQIIIGSKKIKIGILCCHLRSSGQKKSLIRPHQMRKIQVRCIHDFSKRFDKFFCIGDTNIRSSTKLQNQTKWVKRRFIDAYDIGKSPHQGTYLYRTLQNIIRNERLDRVWMKKDMKSNTQIQIKYNEVLLQSCKQKGFDREQMLQQYTDRLIYITLSDHLWLDINVKFTQ